MHLFSILSFYFILFCYCETILLHKGGDLTTKRAKFDQEGGGEILVERHMVDDVASTVDLHISSSHLNFDASTLTTEPPARFEGATMDQLPREMHGMTIRDIKTDGHIETVWICVLFFFRIFLLFVSEFFGSF